MRRLNYMLAIYECFLLGMLWGSTISAKFYGFSTVIVGIMTVMVILSNIVAIKNLHKN